MTDKPKRYDPATGRHPDDVPLPLKREPRPPGRLTTAETIRIDGKLFLVDAKTDFDRAPRCEAKTRSGGTCLNPAMQNGRCRMHGGSGKLGPTSHSAVMQDVWNARRLMKPGLLSEPVTSTPALITRLRNQLTRRLIAFELSDLEAAADPSELLKLTAAAHRLQDLEARLPEADRKSMYGTEEADQRRRDLAERLEKVILACSRQQSDCGSPSSPSPSSPRSSKPAASPTPPPSPPAMATPPRPRSNQKAASRSEQPPREHARSSKPPSEGGRGAAAKRLT